MVATTEEEEKTIRSSTGESESEAAPEEEQGEYEKSARGFMRMQRLEHETLDEERARSPLPSKKADRRIGSDMKRRLRCATEHKSETSGE